jgi:radical SAM superfamily enzyme YgiQ (UPF0313 family)
MVRKVSIIEVKSEHLHIFSRFELPRIGATLLATVLRDRGLEAEALFLPRKTLLARGIQTDLAGISTITATAPASYAVADDLRRRGIPVVIGGPHASFQPEEALEHGEYCLVGEAEQSLPMLVDALNGTRALDDVPGLVWRKNGAIVRNPAARPIDDLDSLPFPDYSLLDMGRRRMGAFLLGGSIVPIQTSRGCPYDCSFCSVTGMFGKRYRFRSTASVITELERYHAGQLFFFYDDNFAANTRHTRELLQAIIDRKFGFQWSTQVRADIARNPELLDLMYQAGCRTVFIGFESVDPRALAEMKKGQSVDEMRFAVRELRRRGIHVHGMFVFGFDADTPETVKATVDFAIHERIDSAQFLLLTPLPGSQLFERLTAEGRINERDWDDYDAHHVTFRPTGFTAWKLQLAQIRAHARFYAWRRVFARLLHGRLPSFLVGVYANRLNHRWKRKERDYLRALRHRPGAAGALPAAG